MKSATVIAAASFLFASFVEAAPVKRDLVIVTATSEVVETVEVTTTVWVDPNPTAAAQATTTDGGFFYEQPSSKPASSTVEAQSSSTLNSSVAQTSVPQTSAPVVSSTPVPSSTAQVYTSVIEVPSSIVEVPSSSYVAPTSIYTPPAPSTTEVPTSVYTPPASSAAPAPTSAPASSGGDYTGSVTYYNPGGALGACGDAVNDSDMSVALAAGLMGAKSNGNDWCGKIIKICNPNGNCVENVKIVDKCPGCKANSLDLTPAVFAAVASDVDGTAPGFTWSVTSS